MENDCMYNATKKISILCTQESHSDNAQIKRLNSQFSPNLKFIHTHNKDNPRSKGIIIIINLSKIKHAPLSVIEIIPGRAISATIEWPENTLTNILTVYAPNVPTDNANFWKSITTAIKDRTFPMPDIILGDFNMVEDPQDRLPPHLDASNSTDALLELKMETNLFDGWRTANPYPERDFTFEQPSGGSRSRIDRIYVNNDIMCRALDWKIENANIPTDHQLTSVKIYDMNTPHIGHGRWAIPKFLTDNPKFLNNLEEFGHRNPTPSNQCPQQSLSAFIDYATATAKHLEWVKAGKMNSTIRKLNDCKLKVL